MSLRFSPLDKWLVLGLALSLIPTISGCETSDDDDGNRVVVSFSFGSRVNSDQEVPTPITGSRIRVTIRNLAPDLGTFQTPVWVGFHNGEFDTYDSGSPASEALERLAEDGTIAPLNEDFTAQGFGTIQGTLAGVLGPAAGPIAPGETVSYIFELDPDDPMHRYFSYASMIIPSNDAFVSNANPLAHPIFDSNGNFVATDFVVDNSGARDAGTEVNDELPANTAFFGQATPDTGVVEGGNVGVHPGFMPPGSGGILDDAMFTNADFTQGGYEFLSFSFAEVDAAPAPDGLVSTQLSEINSELTLNVVASGLTGPVTAMHFHEGAEGETGPVLIDLAETLMVNQNGLMTAQGTVSVDADFISALRSGNIYLNIHTALNPSGEIRGQLSDTFTHTTSLDQEQEIPVPLEGTTIRVTARNLAPDLGTFQTPVWVGFHDGVFDIYDSGTDADLRFPDNSALERLAEDGSLDPINEAFLAQEFGTLQGALFGIAGPLSPGETASQLFTIDSSRGDHQYFSYASMIIPSNDAFVANANSMAHGLFDSAGILNIADFTVDNTGARDAGTEVNDEIPANTAFFGQTTPDTGVDENGVIGVHPGFMPPGSGGILDDAMFANADFTTGGYEFLHFRFQEVETARIPGGSALFTRNNAGDSLTFLISVSGLSGAAQAMHFHQAAEGETGPVEIDLTDSIVNGVDGSMMASGTVSITPAFSQALDDGLIYLNIHTELNPAGEIRGQVEVRN